jgi:hypothetical protein
MTPLDFSLWGLVKGRMLKIKPHTADDIGILAMKCLQTLLE